ncbi:Spy/CpxP family protein refolding chaperone [Parasediminibacterium sp. JCM 36343]|uniref:Spy/CpxP family protein refolding chaperone n=1 Tax=Parasediminibacterium sp. JCM 36343 TaxID=3374279 RepID=UPI00397B4F8E
MKQINNNRWWAVAVLLLMIANITTLCFFWVTSQRGNMPPMGNKGGAAAFLIKELAFDSNQQRAYQALIKQHQETIREIKPRLKEAKEAYFSLLCDTSITENKIKAAAAKANTVEAEIDIAGFHHFQEVRKLCTPQQQKKFDSVIVQTVRMMAPPQQHPPRRGMGGRPDGPPRDGNPPPPDDGPPQVEDGQRPPLRE